ncbi:MAG: site-specific integrase, partial [Alphaproteobacteria bacterium]|nr:site-specific integrase [Alphaproteobacteria bacterium]
IRLLALTGCRKSELLTWQWDHVDFERGCLRLPELKPGAKVVPLGTPALELLSKLPHWEGNPYVLPSAKGMHFVGLQKAWDKIRRSAKLDDVRLHDLRHSFASVAVAGGDSLYLVGNVLATVKRRQQSGTPTSAMTRCARWPTGRRRRLLRR